MRKKMLRAPACLCASGAIAVVSSLRRNTSWTTWPRRTSSRGRAAMTSPASGRSVSTIVRLLYKTVNISSLCSCSAKPVCRTILILKDKIQNFHLQIANVSKSDSSLVTEKTTSNYNCPRRVHVDWNRSTRSTSCSPTWGFTLERSPTSAGWVHPILLYHRQVTVLRSRIIWWVQRGFQPMSDCPLKSDPRVSLEIWT